MNKTNQKPKSRSKSKASPKKKSSAKPNTMRVTFYRQDDPSLREEYVLPYRSRRYTELCMMAEVNHARNAPCDDDYVLVAETESTRRGKETRRYRVKIQWDPNVESEILEDDNADANDA